MSIKQARSDMCKERYIDGTVVVVCVDDSRLLCVNNISQPTRKDSYFI